MNGNLHYDFHYSEMAEFGSAVGNWQTANASASVAYASDNVRRPFSLNYSGGYTWTITGPSYSTGAFQRLPVSGVQPMMRLPPLRIGVSPGWLL